jgi:hypothetical protein
MFVLLTEFVSKPGLPAGLYFLRNSETCLSFRARRGPFKFQVNIITQSEYDQSV